MDYEVIRQHVRDRLIATGATQKEIAEAVGIAQASVGRFLSGEVDPSIKTFYGIIRFIQAREAMDLMIPPPMTRKSIVRTESQ